MGGPADLGSELFCATGTVPAPLDEHAEFLLQQHEAGALRLYDRGALDRADPTAPQRWRMTWQRADGPISAVLVLLAGNDLVRCWFAARSPGGWGLGVPSPLPRAGLARFPLADPRSGLAVTGSALRDDPDDLAGLLAVLRHRRSGVPVLVRHVDREPGRPLEVPRATAEFRRSTAGAATVVFIGDAVARRLDAELPAPQRIPRRGARLFLPEPWAAERADLCLSEVDSDDPGAWAAAAALALQVSRQRSPDDAAAPDAASAPDAADEPWALLFATGWQDQRVADSPVGPGERWFATAGGVDKSDLRHRIQGAGERQAESRRTAARRAAATTELTAEIDERTARTAELHRSRRVLARGALRLRAERDAARERLDRTSLGVARRRAEAARRLGAARSARLAECERELELLRAEEDRLRGGAPVDPEPLGSPDRPGIRFGPEVRAEIDRLDGPRARRCAQVLDLLARHATAPDGPPAALLRDGGIAAPALRRADADTAVTFRVPAEVHPSGWAAFRDHVLLDHAGEPPTALHYLDDTAGTTGAVHIGYVGPEPGAGTR
ncbi:hypothetical protein ABZ805_05600 [Saccharopolyspora sp. NPDC047091]|uniref:hypothetical protein n=1 Tax=Saccharopolyspora sp. NPDC047091 TaxID=3155924 RepID=UPI0034048F7B